MRMQSSHRGDTIIEVVLSMALLTAILLTAWGITNRATQTLVAAKDRVTMVNAVKEQAEIIKSLWATDKLYFADNGTYPSTTITSGANPCSSPQAGQWYLAVDSATGKIEKLSPVKSVGSDSTKRVWVQKVTSTDASQPPYTDFYVRACWQTAVGGGQKEENTQVLVRLNT